MNDRTVNLLERYELEVSRTWKGRGCILCETAQGLKVMKKYEGPAEKVKLQNHLLIYIKEAGHSLTEQIMPNREGELLTVDTDGSAYVVKDFFQGQECNLSEEKEVKGAMAQLAGLHLTMGRVPRFEGGYTPAVFSLEQELLKHTRELRRARKYLHQKRGKNEFERFLMEQYDVFYQKAEQITEEAAAGQRAAALAAPESGAEGFTATSPTEQTCCFCHGDYQHHNVIRTSGGCAVINFEKCVQDSQMRDVCLFLRKLMEKNDWSAKTGLMLLETYAAQKALTAEDWRQIYFRLAYPEKFWKVVNFYFNSGKAWIPEKNMEKLKKLLYQEENREVFLKQVARSAFTAL